MSEENKCYKEEKGGCREFYFELNQLVDEIFINYDGIIDYEGRDPSAINTGDNNKQTVKKYQFYGDQDA